MKKVALIIAGAVSLGSYEAGALTELLYALDKLNKKSNEEGNGNAYELDVITGASAGSLTAAMVARIMMYDYPNLKKNLHDAWVDKIDIVHLLEDPPENALLSKNIIRQIAREYLALPTKSNGPASFAPSGDKPLRTSFAMSNMNGIDYEIPYQVPKKGSMFPTTFFSDFARNKFFANKFKNTEEWNQMVSEAIASGSFPIAFQSEPVKRKPEDYPGSTQAIKNPDFFKDPLAFIDGGMFNNEPLKEAIKLAKEADEEEENPDRIFILVDPNVNKSRSHPDPISANQPFKEYLVNWVKMALGEIDAKDWMRADHTNNKIDWAKNYYGILASLINSSSQTEQHAISQTLKDQANAIIDKKREYNPTKYADDNQTILKRDLGNIIRRNQRFHNTLAIPALKEILSYSIFILDNAAGINNKLNIQFALIGSKKEQTAGDELFAFLGFFKKDWREYDYRKGRIKAHELLKEFLAPYEMEMKPGTSDSVEDYKIPTEWGNFSEARLKEADTKPRVLLRDRVMHLLKAELATTFGMKIVWFFFSSKIRSMIGKQLELVRTP